MLLKFIIVSLTFLTCIAIIILQFGTVVFNRFSDFVKKPAWLNFQVKYVIHFYIWLSNLFYFILFLSWYFFILSNYFWNIWRIHAKYITNQYTKQISKTWRQWTKPESKENQSVYLPENAHIGSTCKFSDLQSPDSSYKILKTFLHL